MTLGNAAGHHWGVPIPRPHRNEGREREWYSAPNRLEATTDAPQ